MRSSATSPEVLREQALRQVKKRRDFHTHVFAFLVVNIVLWGAWSINGVTSRTVGSVAAVGHALVGARSPVQRVGCLLPAVDHRAGDWSAKWIASSAGAEAMRVLTVYAHPNPNSFCHAVLDEFTRGLRDAGHVPDVLDLYAMKFDPVFTMADVATWLHPDMPADVLERWNPRQAVLDSIDESAQAVPRAPRDERQGRPGDRADGPRARPEGRRRAVAPRRRCRRDGVHRTGLVARVPGDPQGLARAHVQLRQRVRARPRTAGRDTCEGGSGC